MGFLGRGVEWGNLLKNIVKQLLGIDENVLYLDCGGGYVSVYIC